MFIQLTYQKQTRCDPSTCSTLYGVQFHQRPTKMIRLNKTVRIHFALWEICASHSLLYVVKRHLSEKSMHTHYQHSRTHSHTSSEKPKWDFHSFWTENGIYWNVYWIRNVQSLLNDTTSIHQNYRNTPFYLWYLDRVISIQSGYVIDSNSGVFYTRYSNKQLNPNWVFFFARSNFFYLLTYFVQWHLCSIGIFVFVYIWPGTKFHWVVHFYSF